MNETKTANAYLRTKVMTASPEELRLMLLDGAVKFANQARKGLVDTDHEMSFSGFTQCRDIVLELLNTIQTEPAPHIAESMRDLYTFLYGELVKASIDKDIPKLDEVISLLEYDRETWVLTMEQVAKEREEGVTSFSQQPVPTHQPISFQA